MASRKIAFRIGLVLVAALSVWSIFTGVIDLTPAQAVTDPGGIALIGISRAPRTLAVLITGAMLAVAGAVMQVILRNRFVEPMTIGTGQGAALGILFASFLIPGAPLVVRMVFATVTALAATFLFLLIVRRLPPTQPLLVPLIGLVYGGLLEAGMTFIAYQYDMLQYIYTWTSGEFSGVLLGRYELLWIAVPVGAALYLIADQLAIIGLGRSMAVSLGLNYGQVMALALLAVAVVVSLTVVTVGMIPFVGLLVPNIVSRRYGDNLRQTLPLVALTGAGLVLASDIFARLVRYPFEVPVGTIFGVMGAVVFLFLLYSRPRHAR